MREAAAKARGEKYPFSTATKPVAELSVSPRMCTYPGYEWTDIRSGETVAVARSRLIAASAKVCAGPLGLINRPGTMVGQIRCADPRSLRLGGKPILTTLASCRATSRCPPFEATCKPAAGPVRKAIAQ
jgi:hypothetical protein